MSVRDLTRYAAYSTTSFGGLDTFLASAPVPGIVTVDYGGRPLDLLIKSCPEADTTVVVFHAATQRDATRPVFTGLGVTRDLKANLVFVSDPALEADPDLILGWFAGTAEQPLQADLPRVLRHVLASFGAEHTVFYGPSGGGFAAMYYSAVFPGTLAIATNPQTTIANFWEHSVLHYVRSCFPTAPEGVPDAMTVLDRHGVVHDLCEMYRGGTENWVAYLQNVPDERHMAGHLRPFAEAVGADASVRYLLGDWGPGHHAPPRELVKDVLRAAVAARGDWAGLCDAVGLVPHDRLPGRP